MDPRISPDVGYVLYPLTVKMWEELHKAILDLLIQRQIMWDFPVTGGSWPYAVDILHVWFPFLTAWMFDLSSFASLLIIQASGKVL